jgi:hypothetical protein
VFPTYGRDFEKIIPDRLRKVMTVKILYNERKNAPDKSFRLQGANCTDRSDPKSNGFYRIIQ